MIDDGLIGRAVSALPALAVLGLGLAIAHAFAMLAPFDRNWISWLTISDLVTLTWTMIPMLALGALAGNLFRVTETPAQQAKRWAKEEKFKRSWSSIVVDVLGFVCLIGFPFVAMISLDFLLSAGRFLPLLAFAHFWGVARLPGRMAKSERFWSIFVTCGAYLMIAAALLTGYTRGEGLRVTSQLAKVTLEDGMVLCQREIYSGQRAVMLFDRIHNETTTVPADRVALVVKTKDCWAQG